MGKITEIFHNRSLIWEGLRNKVFKQEHVEAIFEERMVICKGCVGLDTKGDGCSMPGTQPCCNHKMKMADAIDGTLKDGCGCSLSLKLRSLASECPARKWLAVTNQQEEEMIRQQILNNRLVKDEDKS